MHTCLTIKLNINWIQSYNKYIWHSENSDDTCDVCKSLDGKEFDFYEEVPERPHPNCKCTVEIVEDTSSNGDFERAKEENSNTNRISSENQNPQTSTPQPTSKAPQHSNNNIFHNYPIG